MTTTEKTQLSGTLETPKNKCKGFINTPHRTNESLIQPSPNPLLAYRTVVFILFPCSSCMWVSPHETRTTCTSQISLLHDSKVVILWTVTDNKLQCTSHTQTFILTIHQIFSLVCMGNNASDIPQFSKLRVKCITKNIWRRIHNGLPLAQNICLDFCPWT